MSTEEDIEVALLGRMRTIEFSPTIDIAWPNREYTPTGEPYARVDHLRNPSSRLFLKGSDPHNHMGIFQVTIVSKLEKGPSQASALAGQVVEHFPADLKLFEGAVKVKVTKKPDVSTPLRTDASWDLVVSIPYEAFA